MDVSSPEVSPPSSKGHSATFDPESKAVYVYGGLRDAQRYSDIYILDTITWKWKLVSVSIRLFVFYILCVYNIYFIYNINTNVFMVQCINKLCCQFFHSYINN